MAGKRNSSPPEDPATFFLPASTDSATCTINNGDAPPLFYTAAFNNPGSHAKVALRWIQGGTAGAGRESISVDVDIEARPA